jgi:hypothetical protein
MLWLVPAVEKLPRSQKFSGARVQPMVSQLLRQLRQMKRQRSTTTTGYPGGIKECRADTILDGRFPERVIEKTWS